jgi:hypothetical protein
MLESASFSFEGYDFSMSRYSRPDENDGTMDDSDMTEELTE